MIESRNQTDNDENVEMNNTIDILNRCIHDHCTNKLYGRDHEIQILKTSYNHFRQRQQQQQQQLNNHIGSNISTTTTTTSEFILIHGASGAGKSKLVHYSFISKRHLINNEDVVLCISGTFDQRVHFHKPNTAYIDLLKSFTEQIIERENIDTIRYILKQSSVTDDEIEVLVEIVPALSILFDRKESARNEAQHHTQEDVRCSASISRSNDIVNKFKSAMIKFLRSVATKTCPIIITLEDIHRADESALNFLLSIISDTKNSSLLFVGTTRNDININGLEIMLKKLSCHATTVTHLYLSNLDETSAVAMISDILELKDDFQYRNMICEYVLKQSICNPYCIISSLQRLVELKVLRYDQSTNPHWQYNIDELSLLQVETIYDIITNKLSYLPTDVLDTLKYAAFFGNKIDVEIVCHLMHKSQDNVKSYLQVAAISRYLKVNHCGDFVFSHDFIRDVLIQNISDKEEFQYQIGRRLWQCYDLEGLDENIIVVVDQLLAGERHIAVERERLAVAKLCFRAGERSAHISSFQSAFTYMTKGIELLGTNGWRDEYKLSLDLHNAAAELAYCIGKTDKSLELANIIAVEADNFDDAIVGHTMKVRALSSMNKIDECIEFSLSILRQLGESFPSHPSIARCFIGLQRIRKRLRKKTTESLLRLTMMTNERKIAAVTILNELFWNCIQLRIKLAPLLVFRVISLTLEYGISATSSLGFVTLGAILTGPAHDINEGYRIGQVGMAMHAKYDIKVWVAPLYLTYYVGIHSFKYPIYSMIQPLQFAQQIGAETGNIEQSIMCGIIINFIQLENRPLAETEVHFLELRQKMSFYGLTNVMMISTPSLKAVQCMLGRHKIDTILEHEVTADSLLYIFKMYYVMMLSYYFGNFDVAASSSTHLHLVSAYPLGGIDAAYITFYVGLVAIQHARIKCRNPRYGMKKLRQLRDYAKHSPNLFLCRQYLLEAEIASTKNDDLAYSKYYAAIAQAKDAGNISITALGNELAGNHFLRSKNDRETAITFFQEAIYYYEKWGAIAKVNHLRQRLEKA